MTQLEYVSVAEAPFTEIFSRYVEGVGCSAGGGAAWSSVEQREGWGCWTTMRVHGAGNVAQSAIRSVSERVDKERSDWQSTEQLLIVLWAKLHAGAPCAERCRLTTSPPPKLRNAAGGRTGQ